MKEGNKALLADIFDGLRSQPGRVGLSFMAIAVGITALTVLLAVLGGLRERSKQIVGELGANVFAIQANPEAENSVKEQLHTRQLETLANNLPGCRLARVWDDQVPLSGLDEKVTVLGTEPNLLPVRQWSMVAGRFLDERDVHEKARHAVLSEQASRAWNVRVGQVLQLRSVPFTIIGIVRNGAAALDSAGTGSDKTLGERTLFIPHTVEPYWNEDNYEPITSYSTVYIQVPNQEEMDPALAIAKRLMTHPDQRAGTFSWITPDALLQRLKKLQQTVKLTVGSISILCLILGGTTLMSLMVANVRDRIREIGLRRALGATSKDIALLFVVEACIVTASAALVGTVLTHAALWVGQKQFPIPLDLGPTSLLLPLLVAILLGAAFSYWPAKSAAAISPSDALRVE